MYQIIYVGYLAFVGLFTFEYIVPFVSEKFNKMYYDHLFIQDDRNITIQYLDDKIYKIEQETESFHIKIKGLINDLENKLNYLDLSYKRDIKLEKNNMLNLKDRIYIVEKELKNSIILKD